MGLLLPGEGDRHKRKAFGLVVGRPFHLGEGDFGGEFKSVGCDRNVEGAWVKGREIDAEGLEVRRLHFDGAFGIRAGGRLAGGYAMPGDDGAADGDRLLARRGVLKRGLRSHTKTKIRWA